MPAACISKCCRSTPRCASCPVLLARRHKDADLVTKMLLPPVRTLPAPVAEQLELLAAARTAARRPLPAQS